MLDTLMAHLDMQFVNNPQKPDVCDLDKIRSQKHWVRTVEIHWI